MYVGIMNANEFRINVQEMNFVIFKWKKNQGNFSEKKKLWMGNTWREAF